MKSQTFLRVLRVNNYVKNVFIFAPLFFVFDFDPQVTLETAFVFVLFSLLTSSVYILNDIFDRQSDKNHPVKSNRPIAAGDLSIRQASTIALILVIISFSGIIILKLETVKFFMAYIFLNILYNVILKKIPVVDVIVLALGFVIRILVGSSISDVPASLWMLTMTFLLSIFLAFSKRRADFLMLNKRANQKLNLECYSLKTLNIILYTLGMIISMSYFFYTLSREVRIRWNSNFVFVTTLWVVGGITRYLTIIYRKSRYYTPTSITLSDPLLQGIIVSWILTFVLIYYL